MPGHGWIAAGGVISVDVRGRWWIDSPVEGERVVDSEHLREIKEIGIEKWLNKEWHEYLQSDSK